MNQNFTVADGSVLLTFGYEGGPSFPLSRLLVCDVQIDILGPAS